ncbi:phage portal protein [Rhizobium leguminosarum]|uniref:phage portal protein n=1 Tax=Rhizobium leguminosarum TaxID=384 RepID=UPI0014413036|nr:phage portal protein [Rhizobium leguminosarum]NKL63305.1 phage portal protein [Rhizobium leguminosarum bv. viciae]
MRKTPTRPSAPKKRISAPPAAPFRSPKRAVSIRSSHFDNFGFSASRTYFEAASNSNRIMQAPDGGPNAYNSEIDRVRQRSRWAYLNNSFYRQAVRQVANNVIHYGIKPRIKNKVLRKLWAKWGKECDARGRTDIYGGQWLMVATTARDGGALCRMRGRRPGDMRSGINFQLQFLEDDYLPLDKNEVTADGNLIVSGVERDQIERVVAYWLYDFHPKDLIKSSATGNVLPRRVPAADVLHIYMPDRLSDTRGYPWGASALNKAESVKSVDEAYVETRRGQAMHGGFITKPAGEEAPVLSTDGIEADGIEFAGMEPGTWTVLPDGHSVEFANPPQADPNYRDFKRSGIAELAVAFGLAPEHIDLDFRDLNDRQYRGLMLEVQRYLEVVQYHMIVFQMMQPIWERFVSEAFLNDLWAPEAGKTVEDYFEIEWITPARGYINPIQEVAAYSEAIKNGLSSRKRVSNSFGEDVEDIDEDNAADQARARGYGLQYPIYPALEFEQVLKQSMAESDADDDPEQDDDATEGSVPPPMRTSRPN